MLSIVVEVDCGLQLSTLLQESNLKSVQSAAGEGVVVQLCCCWQWQSMQQLMEISCRRQRVICSWACVLQGVIGP